MMASSPSAQGFTLMEVLVAISVLAIALVVILQLFSGGLKLGRTSETTTLGMFHADAKISEILLTEPLTPGVERGRFADGYTWRSEIERVVQSDEEAAKLPFDMFQVTVTVSWGDQSEGEGKQVTLTTLKLIRKDEEGSKTRVQ